jgi:hypothetical protein
MKFGYSFVIGKLSWLVACTCFAAVDLGASAIQYQFTPLPTPGQYRYVYFLNTLAVTLVAREELDLQFDSNVYSSVSNAVAGSDFQALTLPPDNPPGAFGDYILLALVDNPSLAGPFSVDVTLKGSAIPGQQPFLLNQLDQNGKVISNIGSGVTTQAGTPQGGSTESPEPRTIWTCVAGLLLMGLGRTVRSRTAK